MGSQEDLKKSTRTSQKLKFIKDIRLKKISRYYFDIEKYYKMKKKKDFIYNGRTMKETFINEALCDP